MPAELDVHIICDNYATHKTDIIANWLAKHPRFHIHFIPTGSSWMNMIERWFGELTTKLLQRGVHKSVQALEADIRAWIDTWNEDPRPYVWTKSADESSTASQLFVNELQAQDTSTMFAVASVTQFLWGAAVTVSRHRAILLLGSSATSLPSACGGHPHGRPVSRSRSGCGRTDRVSRRRYHTHVSTAYEQQQEAAIA